MKLSSSFAAIVLFTISVVQADDELAIAALTKAGATVERDESQDGKPLRLVRYNLRQVTDEGNQALREIDDLPAIEFLGAGDTEITVATLRALRGKDSLRRFAIRYAKIGDEAAKILGTLKSLTALDLRTQVEISPVGLDEIFELVRLRELTLSDRLVNDATMENLTRLPALKDLNVRSIFVTDAGLDSLTRLGSLQTLQIFIGDGVTTKGLQHLSELRLKRVEIHYFNAKDPCLKELRKVGGLKVLRLMNARNLTDVSIEYLSEMNELQELEIVGSKFGRPLIEALKKTLLNCKVVEKIL